MLFFFGVAVAFGIAELEKPGEFFILCAQNISDKAGDKRGDWKQEIDPPKRIERRFRRNPVCKNAGEHPLDDDCDGDANAADFAEEGKIRQRAEHDEDAQQKVDGICQQGNEQPGERLVLLSSAVDGGFIAEADFPGHGVKQEQIKQDGKSTCDIPQNGILRLAGSKCQNKAENCRCKLVEKHFDGVIGMIAQKRFHECKSSRKRLLTGFIITDLWQKTTDWNENLQFRNQIAKKCCKKGRNDVK